MPWETVELSREQLHQMVWSRPVQEVARGIGVSGVALAKTCRRMGVPVPERGYWARVAAGTPHRQPPLPELGPGQEEFHEYRRWLDPPGVERRSDGSDAAQANEIIVPDELANPHRLVAASLPLLRQPRELREGLLRREACLRVVVETHALMGRAIRMMDQF